MNVIEIIDSEIADLQTAKRVLLRLAAGSVAVEPPKAIETTATPEPPPFKRPWKNPSPVMPPKKPFVERPRVVKAPSPAVAEKAKRDGAGSTEQMTKRRILLARFISEKGPSSFAEIARAVAIPQGSVHECLTCNWFAKAGDCYTLAEPGRAYLKETDRG